MGGLRRWMPVTNATFLIGCVAIAGIPPFSGFFSKDEILAAAFAKSPVYYAVGLFTALLTAFYMFRLYATTFSGGFRGTHEQEHHLHESPSAITIPLIVLAILATVAGFLGIPGALAPDAHVLGKYLAPVVGEGSKVEVAHGTELGLMALAAVLALATSLLAWSRFKSKPDLAEPTGFGKVLANKWYVDEFYNAIIVRPLDLLAQLLVFIEKNIIDGIVNGVGRLVQYGSRQLRLLQSGQVGGYVLLMVVGILVLFLVELFVKK
jgi:NADH-quinone oxidoreductase subunit L